VQVALGANLVAVAVAAGSRPCPSILHCCFSSARLSVPPLPKSLSFSLAHSLSLSLSHTHTLSLSLSRTHSRSPFFLSHSRVSLFLSFILTRGIASSPVQTLVLLLQPWDCPLPHPNVSRLRLAPRPYSARKVRPPAHQMSVSGSSPPNPNPKMQATHASSSTPGPSSVPDLPIFSRTSTSPDSAQWSAIPEPRSPKLPFPYRKLLTPNLQPFNPTPYCTFRVSANFGSGSGSREKSKISQKGSSICDILWVGGASCHQINA
jgi:hypothetical protein